jgi:hypothetical protein
MLLRSDGRKLARQSEQLVRARKSKTPMVARLRPTKTGNMGAMLRMSPRTSNSPRDFVRARHRNTARGSACRRGRAIGREASPGQDIGINREHGHFPTATLRWRSISPFGKWPTSLIKPNWSDTPPVGYTAVCRGFPFALSPHSLPFRSTSGESETHNRLRGGVGMKQCFRDITQHTLSVWSLILRFHINSDRADNSPCRDPSARNLCQTMCHCVLSRCFTVTLTANPHLRARAGSQRASSQASFTPTPPLRHTRSQWNWLAPLDLKNNPGWPAREHQRVGQWEAELRLFRSVFFCSCVSLHRPHGVSPRPTRPLVVPSKDYSHEGGLGLPLFHEGQKTHSRAEKKRP